MSSKNKKKHWTNQEGIAHRQSALFDGPKTTKVYVVFRGKMPGIYNTWAECQRQTNGYRNAVFRSYQSREAAEEALTSFVLPATTDDPVQAFPKSAKTKVDPLIKSRAKALVRSPRGSNTFTCVDTSCTYPACTCGTTP